MKIKLYSLEITSQTKQVGANNRTALTIMYVLVSLNVKNDMIRGGSMTKNKNNKAKRNNALPKVDVEFAEERGNGFEKVALKGLKEQNK